MASARAWRRMKPSQTNPPQIVASSRRATINAHHKRINRAWICLVIRCREGLWRGWGRCAFDRTTLKL